MTPFLIAIGTLFGGWVLYMTFRPPVTSQFLSDSSRFYWMERTRLEDLRK